MRPGVSFLVLFRYILPMQEIKLFKTELRKVDELIPYIHNPNEHPEKQIDIIAASFKKYGCDTDIIIDENNEIIAGHGRILAAKKLGMKEIGVKVQPLSKADKVGRMMADNKIAKLSVINEAEEALNLGFLKENDYDFESTGYDVPEVDQIISDMTPDFEGKTDEDAIPDEDDTPKRCKLGQLWKLGDHRLLCGDCTDKEQVERLMDGKKADMVFTDPPYNIAEKGKNVASNVKDGKAYNILKNSDWDYGFVPSRALDSVSCFLSGSAAYFVFTSHFLFGEIQSWMEENLFYNNYLVWCKPNPMPSLTKRRFTWATELINYGTAGKGHAFNFPEQGHFFNYLIENSPSHTTEHPTEKPVAVLLPLIESSSLEFSIILEPFCGSGSTLIACEKTNRKCYGMEIDPHYCDVILKRWEDYTSLKAELIEDAS